MSKMLLILQREYTSRVLNKWFWILTLLIPLGFGLIMLVPILIQSNTTPETSKVAVVDHSGLIATRLQNTVGLEYTIRKENLEEVKTDYLAKGQTAVLYIGRDLDLNKPDIRYFSEKSPSLITTYNLTDQLNQALTDLKLQNQGIDPKVVAQTRSDYILQTTLLGDKGSESASSTGFATALGFGSAMIIYVTLLIYGSMVMQGVIEEKSSRVVEILISSVKPYQLMLGKILGIVLVGFTQLLLWLVLIIGIMFIGGVIALSKISSSVDWNSLSDMGTQIQQVNNLDPELQSVITNSANGFGSVNVGLIVFCFIFYFLGGYLLYSSIFAAIGSLGENERDVQGLTFPIILPIVAGILIMTSSLDNPNGPLAVAGSIIPFTSPIVMMARLPFGVPWWELVLSLSLLIASFFGMIWVAAKIYRYGILRYGQKPKFSDLWKWIQK